LGRGVPDASQEIYEAIQKLTEGQRLRIRKAARFLIPRTDFSAPDELINETLDRFLSGSRTWPRHVEFATCLINAMRSVANGSREQLAGRPEIAESSLLPSATGDANDVVGPVAVALDEGATPEDVIAREQRILHQAELLRRIQDHFKDDDEIQWIFMGLEDGWSAIEVLEQSGMNRTQYETARRRLRRQLDRFFPEGSAT